MSDRKLVDFDLKAVASHLRAVHPSKTAEHVAARIDAPVETVRQWLRLAAKPGFCATLKLIGAYGPELLAAALPSLPDWAARALIAERRRAAMDELRRLEERLGGFHADDGERDRPDRMGDGMGAGFRGRVGVVPRARGDVADG